VAPLVSHKMADDPHEYIGYADAGHKARDYGNDLEDVGQSATEVINIDVMYQPAWGPKEGFREIYQNWYVPEFFST
jgi:hypothetical protein